MEKIIFVRDVDPVPVSKIAAAVSQGTGMTWYVLGEPNVTTSSANDLVVGLHDTYVAIKAADPTAKILSPSILNFDYVCDLTCGGYTSGRIWMESFFDAYGTLYGEEPPVDYWAIDSYPIRWNAADPATLDTTILKSDITAYRQFLDTKNDQANKPIIVTELGIHWGYSGVTFTDPNCSGWYPAGSYLTEDVKSYLGDVYTWLENQSGTLNISEWFTFSTYRDLSACQSDSGYGLTMFDGPGISSNLSPIGQFYYDWIRGVRP